MFQLIVSVIAIAIVAALPVTVAAASEQVGLYIVEPGLGDQLYGYGQFDGPDFDITCRLAWPSPAFIQAVTNAGGVMNNGGNGFSLPRGVSTGKAFWRASGRPVTGLVRHYDERAPFAGIPICPG